MTCRTDLMALIRDAPLLLGDTGPFCRLAETKALDCLRGYLAHNLMIVREVEVELRFRSTQPEHRELERVASDEPPFVAFEAIDLDELALRRVTIVAERWRDRAVARGKAQRGERANYGEIATVFAAVERGAPVLMDDGEGKALAQARGLTVHTTEDLLAEMVAATAMKARLGFLAYIKVYGSDRVAFDAAVADALAHGA
jgi:hypothetical protein